ncbi:unnamed protein product [Prorocentrum cordatum]|uniref:Aminoglycoside phosphotransferase domain-containing protein n=1 Tax=Prorocentrum cordatum TaxID=2364126 RepID=A0ABN9T6Z2_9DINO|nr:unnamed protein product [Polarella glacialis]
MGQGRAWGHEQPDASRSKPSRSRFRGAMPLMRGCMDALRAGSSARTRPIFTWSRPRSTAREAADTDMRVCLPPTIGEGRGWSPGLPDEVRILQVESVDRAASPMHLRHRRCGSMWSPILSTPMSSKPSSTAPMHRRCIGDASAARSSDPIDSVPIGEASMWRRGCGMGGGKSILEGGVDVAIAEMGYSTFGMLKKFAIPYHEVHFGKPHADVYIDSRSLNGQADVERDLGWYTTQQSHEADEFAAIEGAIDARAFNLVRAAGTSRVIKSSTADILRGENHWYRSIPSGLKDLFPEPFEIVDGDEATNQMSSITMSKVAGVTFSHLATSRLLMQVWVRKLVRSLHRIHTQAAEIGSPGALEARATPEELCSNYANKVRKRTEKHKELYDSLGVEIGIDTGKMAECIINFMEDFEANQKTQWAQFIHGDPVFSNIIRTDDDGIILIDMRGEIGKRLTTQGDIHYDLSKVYQSLCGYDFMLLDQSLDEATSEIFDGLRAAYWQEVSELYPDISHRNVRLHTASHFFAIVPLHEVRSRMVRYLKTSHSMLLVEGLMS